MSGRDALTVVPARPYEGPAPYAATLGSMGRALRRRMPRLLGRDEELAQIAAFATSGEGYRWLVGGAFAGKTTLLYMAVTAALPDTVDVISYFLRRVEQDNNANRFLEAVIPQLAVLCEVSEPLHSAHTYRALWDQAVSRAQATDRHLLLVVDGLDEDQPPANTPWVASLLPDRVAGAQLGADHAHVHVTSRPHPHLPLQVTEDAGHPLNHAARVTLAGFPGWEELRDLGQSEIDELLRPGGLARNVIGQLAAAAGPLSPADLARLQRGDGHDDAEDDLEDEIEDLLARRAARSLQPVGFRGTLRYSFAHVTLLEHAQKHPMLDKPKYRQRIHSWADSWQKARWSDTGPAGTNLPRYFLDSYPTTPRR